MGYRNLGDIDEKILDAIVAMGAKSGLGGISSKKVANACDISSGTIFNKFGTMEQAIEAAASRFHHAHLRRIDELSAKGLSGREIWDNSFDEILSDKQGTLFYISYLTNHGIEKKDVEAKIDEMKPLMFKLFSLQEPVSKTRLIVLWDYYVAMTLYYAGKILSGQLDYSDEAKHLSGDIVFGGAKAIIDRPDDRLPSSLARTSGQPLLLSTALPAPLG